jgi:CO dehydrogenase maturation factor
MAKHIAVTGKGGTGKTTITSLLIRYLIQEKKGTILAVDADPNANLNEGLGLEVDRTISEIMEEIRKNKVPTSMTKETYLQFQVQQALIETKYVDLLVMGAPQGSGCYCFPTELLKHHLESLDSGYDYMVIDNEAGMEHISRQTIENMDIMLVVSDATAKGIRTAGRIYRLARDLKINIGEAYLIVTRITDPAPLLPEIEATGLTLLGTIPFDPQVAEFDQRCRPMTELPADSPAAQAASEMFRKLSV